MIDSIQHCIEALEEGILGLESGSGQASEVMERLGLTHVKLPSAQVIALLDMLSDGITPVNQDIATALLGLCEAHKKLLYALAGLLEHGAGVLRQAQDLEPAPVDVPGATAAFEGADESAPREQAPAPQPAPEAEAAPAAGEHEEESPPAAAQQQAKQSAISSVRVTTDRLDHLMELVGKLMVTYAVISQSGTGTAGKSLSGLRELDALISQLQGEVEAIRLVPLKQIFTPMQRLVSSLAAKVGKKVRLELAGEDLALDKSLVEGLNEPLVHLLRNAVDHGLEAPEERQAAGKDETGTVRIAAARSGETASIRVSDDGRGLNPQRIRAKAVERGLLREDQEVSEEEVLRFVLRSGFSTAEKITDISGRGVGMDAVVNAIRTEMDGEIDIASEPGHGATFTISIPLTRSSNDGIVEALVCRLGQETFLIPSHEVVEIYVPRSRDVVELPDGNETVDVRGEICSLLRLDRHLGLPACTRAVTACQAVVVRGEAGKTAILVDEVLRQQQVVITNFTVPVQEIYSLPLLGFGLMGESDAVVVDVEGLLQRCARADAPALTPPPSKG